jgi:hypothetical protein
VQLRTLLYKSALVAYYIENNKFPDPNISAISCSKYHSLQKMPIAAMMKKASEKLA